MVLDADARSAGDEDYVATGAQGVENGPRLVGDEAGKVHNATVALGKRGEHRPVGVGDLEVARASTRRAAARCR